MPLNVRLYRISEDRVPGFLILATHEMMIALFDITFNTCIPVCCRTLLSSCRGRVCKAPASYPDSRRAPDHHDEAVCDRPLSPSCTCLPSGTAHKADVQPGTSSGLYSTWNRSLGTLPTALLPGACLYAFHNISPHTAQAPDNRDGHRGALVYVAFLLQIKRPCRTSCPTGLPVYLVSCA